MIKYAEHIERVKTFLTGTLKKAESVSVAVWEKVERLVGDLGRAPIGENKGIVNRRVLVYYNNTSRIAEEYKILRTNLYQLSPGKEIKTVQITSSVAGEGKTVTASNLAVTLSAEGKRVLLIDADFRRPSIHRMFAVDPSEGFANVLTNDADIEKFIAKPVLPNLFVIPAGFTKTDPLSMLMSDGMRKILNSLRARFDYIIIDSPPVLGVADAIVVGSACDAVMLVVKAGSTQQVAIDDAVTAFEAAHVKISAGVLTSARPQIPWVYRKYYHGEKGKDKKN
jgi:capsular exopolysaccharide synthesis family protein